MSKRTWKKITKRLNSWTKKLRPLSQEKSIFGLWGEKQVRKLSALRQRIVVMQMSARGG